MHRSILCLFAGLAWGQAAPAGKWTADWESPRKGSDLYAIHYGWARRERED